MKLYIKKLAKQVMPFMRKRHATPMLAKPINKAMIGCGLTFHKGDPAQEQQQQQQP